MKPSAIGFLLYCYLFSLGFYTLFNNSGILPASLGIAAFLAAALALRLLSEPLKIPPFSLMDLLVLAFLFISTCSVLLSAVDSRTLNMNHLYAHYGVMGFYYFVIRWSLANTSLGEQPAALLRVLNASFLVIVLTIVIDYGFLLKGINIADYLPMETANKVAGTGVFSRPRGFFVEPTDLGLALNALAPIVMVYLYLSGKRIAFVMTLLLFVMIHMLARSAAAFAGFFAGLIVMAGDMLLRARPSLVLSKATLRYAAVLLVMFAGLFAAFKDIVIYNIASMTIKIFSVEQSASASQRHEAWQDTLTRFSESPNIMLGYGTGYLSAKSNSSLSWFLSVLTENGILGMLLLLAMIAAAMLKIFAMSSRLRYGFYIAFVAVVVHLMTNSGFYYPFFWLLLVMIQMDWTNLRPSVKRLAIYDRERDAFQG